jgi:hypothetical protein
MAEILGLGLSHYPPLCLPDADMAGILKWTLQDPRSHVRLPRLRPQAASALRSPSRPGAASGRAVPRTAVQSRRGVQRVAVKMRNQVRADVLDYVLRL